jgi:flavin-binding protein dodecin
MYYMGWNFSWSINSSTLTGTASKSIDDAMHSARERAEMRGALSSLHA